MGPRCADALRQAIEHQPQGARIARFSDGPRCVDGVADNVGFHQDSSDGVLMMSCDEKSQMQALDLA